MNARAEVPVMIEGVALLQGLEKPIRERLAAEASILTVSRSDAVFRQGEACAGLHVVIEGQVKLLMRTGNGHEKVFEVIGPNETMGETALFLGLPYPVAAEAVVDTRLMHLAKGTLLRELASDSMFALRVIESLARRLNRHTEDLKSYMLLSGTQRVICFLLQEIPDVFSATDAVEVTLPTRKGVIASKLNLTQEHFSRILRDLTAASLIEVAGARIRIPDVARLRDYQMAQE